MCGRGEIPFGGIKGKQGDAEKGKKGHTIDGANGEAQPAILVPVQNE